MIEEGFFDLIYLFVKKQDWEWKRGYDGESESRVRERERVEVCDGKPYFF